MILILIVILKPIQKIGNAKLRYLIRILFIVIVPFLIYYLDLFISRIFHFDGWKQVSLSVAEIALNHSGWVAVLLSYSIVIIHITGFKTQKIEKIAWSIFLIANLISLRYYLLIGFFPLLLLYPITFISLLLSRHKILTKKGVTKAFLIIHSFLLVIGINFIISEGGTWGNIGQLLGAFIIPLSTIFITYVLTTSESENFIATLKIFTGIVSLILIIRHINNFSNEIYESSSVLRFRFLSQIFCILLILEGLIIKYKGKLSLTLKNGKGWFSGLTS
jgi:hypothetical protein